jgi:hypothetical protein
VPFICDICLQGAGLEGVFQDIITHKATTTVSPHESAPLISPPSHEVAASAALPLTARPRCASPPASSWAVHVTPLQPPSIGHNCPLCPASLCKGMYVNALHPHHSRIVFCGDGANDVCAVLCLRAHDVAFVRDGFRCHTILRERAQRGAALEQPVCTIKPWQSQVELANLLRPELDI